MVLFFDMVSSCWRQVVVPDSKQPFVGFIPVTGLIAPNFQRAHDGIAAILAIESKRTGTDR
jgi:hypothetical protein